VGLFYLAYFLWSMGSDLALEWYSPIAITRFGASNIDVTVYFAFSCLFWIFGSLIINPILLAFCSSYTLSFLGLIFASILIFSSTFFSNILFFSLIYFISVIFCALSMTNLLNLISISSSQEEQGKAMGLSSSMVALAWIIVPFIGSAFKLSHIISVYWLCALFIFIAFLILLFKKQDYKQ
jgi:predicted MFS family arabinose efflux permease